MCTGLGYSKTNLSEVVKYFAILFATCVLLLNIMLASQVDFMLYLLAVPEVLLGLGLSLGFVVSVAKKPGQRSLALALMSTSLLSSIPLIYMEPYFVNRLVSQAGPDRLLADARTLCEAYEAEEFSQEKEAKWSHIQSSDPRLGALGQLNGIYAMVNYKSVSLKMGGMIDMYWGITITPEGVKSSSVDWSQTWMMNKTVDDGGVRRASRVIAPGIEWNEWSAP